VGIFKKVITQIFQPRSSGYPKGLPLHKTELSGRFNNESLIMNPVGVSADYKETDKQVEIRVDFLKLSKGYVPPLAILFCFN